jgi:predicted amidohydrolase
MADTFHGGSYNDADAADTMVAEMRAALKQARAEAGITAPLPTGTNAYDMNILFAAIARGILNHMAKHPKAIEVTATDGTITVTGYPKQIDISNT